MLLGSLAFVGIGLWFVISPPAIQNAYWGHPAKLAVIGYAAIFFFGLCAYFFLRILSSSKPGLVIDDNGLLDRSGALSAGHISWHDIENISVMETQQQKLIMLEVKNPRHYINRQENRLKRKAMEMNEKMYGTPLSITASGLKISFDDLLDLLSQKFSAAKSDVHGELTDTSTLN